MFVVAKEDPSYRTLLIFRADEVAYDADTETLFALDGFGGQTPLRGGETVLVGGGSLGSALADVEQKLTLMNPPGAACEADAYWSVADVVTKG